MFENKMGTPKIKLGNRVLDETARLKNAEKENDCRFCNNRKAFRLKSFNNNLQLVEDLCYRSQYIQ